MEMESKKERGGQQESEREAEREKERETGTDTPSLHSKAPKMLLDTSQWSTGHHNSAC